MCDEDHADAYRLIQAVTMQSIIHSLRNLAKETMMERLLYAALIGVLGFNASPWLVPVCIGCSAFWFCQSQRSRGVYKATSKLIAHLEEEE